MDEIEVKILDINRKKVEERLVSLGAEKVFDGLIHGYFYDSPDSRVRRNKDTFRLRMVGDKSFITLKKFVSDEGAKIRREYEVEVSDFDSAKSIIEGLGFSAWMEMRKRRTSYVLGDVHFELDKHIDQYSFVPEFLEIESKDVGTLYKYVGLLGYGKEDCRPWTIVEVARHYRP